jgi:hypothetical protein
MEKIIHPPTYYDDVKRKRLTSSLQKNDVNEQVPPPSPEPVPPPTPDPDPTPDVSDIARIFWQKVKDEKLL